MNSATNSTNAADKMTTFTFGQTVKSSTGSTFMIVNPRIAGTNDAMVRSVSSRGLGRKMFALPLSALVSA